jgi:hypothetical protein
MTPYANWDSVVQPALNGLIATGGGDAPESQLVAIYLALMGAGLDLNGNGSYADPGDVNPVNNLINLNINQRIGVIHFTSPDVVHDRDIEPDYPQPLTPNLNTPGVTAVNSALAARSCVLYNLLVAAPLDDLNGECARIAQRTGGVVANAGPSLENLRGAILEILVNAGASPAAVTRRNSTPPNPSTYGANPMILGQTWTGSILLGSSPSSPILGAVVASFDPADTLMPPGGYLLVDPATVVLQLPVTPRVNGFARFQFNVPNAPWLNGLTLYSQGVMLSPTSWSLTNAEDLVVGNNPVRR